MKTTFIYTLSDPRTGLVRYVGKTDTPLIRAKEHLKRGLSVKAKWVQSLRAAGVSPLLEILDEVPFGDWMFWEQYWIQTMRGWGFRLVNGDNGGLGHFRLPLSVAAKISKTLKGRPLPERQRSVAQYTLDGDLVGVHPSFVAAARSVGATTHANICRGIKKNRAACGFLWRHGVNAPAKIESPYINGRIPISAERRAQIGEFSRRFMRGRKVSEETRRKQSIAAKNRRNKHLLEVT